MTSELTVRKEIDAAVLEKLLIVGDLSRLSPGERVQYYRAVCESIGVNYLTKPFGYIAFRNGELKLYALKDCTDQIRRIYGVSVGLPEKVELIGCIALRVLVSDRAGRTDSAIGAVPNDNLRGEALANAAMKAETKAKRRATLSLCGLGFLDESEVQSIEGARIVDENYKPVAPLMQVKIEPNPAQEYYYDTSELEEPKRSELETFLSENGITQTEPGVWKSPRELKKIASLRIDVNAKPLPFDDDLPADFAQSPVDEKPLEKAKKRAAAEIEALERRVA